MASTHDGLMREGPTGVRAAIRAGRYRAHTAGLAAGFLQVNLAILPEAYALDFMRYCQRNPKPCPLSGVSDTGSPILHTLGRDIDVRWDVPAYNVYREGRLAGSVEDLADLWRDDLVTFALGCSFTFEHALLKAEIPVWNVSQNKTVPMFRSALDTVPAGSFRGKMVVSMRPIPEHQVEEARTISARFPGAHGAPVHAGDPSEIGISDVTSPDWGDAAPIGPGEVPVFWACGVTPQVAIEAAALPLCITHKPGHMLVTDVPEDAESPILAPA
ncbi:MAG: putative hydro-lyase [Pseudomonadota bacterium]